MVKRRRNFFFDDDIVRIFERMMEDMERMIKEFEDVDDFEKLAKGGKSFVRIFSKTIGSDEKPIIREYREKPETTEKEIEEKKGPLIDIIDKKDEINVIAELPGVRKEDIKLNASEKTLEIKVATEQKKYYKKLELPAKIKPETLEAKYNNGVLEVSIKKVESSKENRNKKK